MKKTLLRSLLVAAAMFAVGMNVSAKEEVTDQYLVNADLNSLGGWDQAGYTAWRNDVAVPVIEFWNWSNQFYFTQTVTLPKGNYRLAVNSFYRESWGGNGTNNNMAWIFAGEKKQNVIALNSMSDLSGYAGGNDLERAATAFSQGKFSNEFDFSIDADDTAIEIGFKGTTPNGGWCILGPVKLWMYTLEDYMVDYRAKVAEAEPYLTEKMAAATLAALKAAIVEESSLTSADDIAAAIQTLNEAITAAKASIAAYEKLDAALTKGEAFLVSCVEYGAPESCKNDLNELRAAYENCTIADADIDATIAQIQPILLAAAKQQTKAGGDMTPLLVNPDFELNASWAEGWTIERTTDNLTGNNIVGGNAFNHCFEAWNNSGFDVYQVVENAPYGVYEIQVQGFYRYGRDDVAWNAYQAQEVDYVKPAGVPVYVYMNDNATPFTNVFAETPIPYGELYTTDASLLNPGNTPPYVEPSGQYWYPNEMYNSALAFSQGMYRQSAHGLVAFEGDVLRLGVKGKSNQLGDSWVIWDDFKLIYRGFDPEVIKPVLEEAVTEVETNYIGLLMGKTEYAAFTNALTKAEEAITNNDGEKMFEALRELYAAKDPALVSKDIFLREDVAADTTRLDSAIVSNASAKMANFTRTSAQQLLYDIKNNLKYENDQIDKLKLDVDSMIDAMNYSVELYAEMNDKAKSLRNNIASVEEQLPQLKVLAEAKNLCDVADAHYNSGDLNDEDVPAFIERLKKMQQELLEYYVNYIVMQTALSELYDAINRAKDVGVDAADIATAQAVYDAGLAAFNAGEMGRGDIADEAQKVVDATTALNQAIDVVTGIGSVTNSTNDGPAYNMGGQKVKNQKGLIIKNSKKVVVK